MLLYVQASVGHGQNKMLLGQHYERGKDKQ
jgi:hypothetical protein